jgi:hypothetical protein
MDIGVVSSYLISSHLMLMLLLMLMLMLILANCDILVPALILSSSPLPLAGSILGPVFAVITTVVKYVRTVLHQTDHFARHNSTKLRCQCVRYRSTCTIQIYHLYGQDIAKTFHQERELIS